jgi:hypothetical protein
MALSDMRLEQQKQACEIEAKLAACCCDLFATTLQRLVQSSSLYGPALATAAVKVLPLTLLCGGKDMGKPSVSKDNALTHRDYNQQKSAPEQ